MIAWHCVSFQYIAQNVLYEDSREIFFLVSETVESNWAINLFLLMDNVDFAIKPVSGFYIILNL